MINQLPDPTYIQFDGTFKVVPKLFLQLFDFY